MNVKKILLFIAVFSVVKLFAQPASPAPTPPNRTATNVISVYSGAYTNLAGTDFNPNWGQSGFGVATEVTISGNATRYYPNMNYQGIQLASNQNVSALDSLHLDVWSSNCTSLDIFLISNSGGPVVERGITKPLNQNSWNRIDIKLTDYSSGAGGVPLTSISQFKFAATPFGGSNVYIDNIYFYTNSNLPTLSNFSVPPMLFGAAPFTITAPTSNSSGAFSYTSSNTSVATISGNTVTITGGGTTVITATQAAAGSFAQGTITTNFTVSFPPLSTNAPAPTKPAVRVISLFSDTYNNVPVDTWRTSWSAATLVDTTVSGNNIKKYTALDFVGIEFVSPGPQINATLADTFHISIWTPNANKFGVKLVDFGPNGTYQGGDDSEGEVRFTSDPADVNLPNKVGEAPTQGQWNNYSIPLSRFVSAGLTGRTKLSQLILTGSPAGASTVYVDNVYFSSTSAALPVTFTTVTASKQNNGASIKWNVAQEINVAEYIVEKSTNGTLFSAIATVTAKGNSTYSAYDNSILSGTNYYRIKAVNKDGKISYSATTSLNSNAKGDVISIYPNPTTNYFVATILEANSALKITNVLGQQVKQYNNMPVGNSTISVAGLPKGNYTVSVIANGKIQSANLIVE